MQIFSIACFLGVHIRPAISQSTGGIFDWPGSQSIYDTNTPFKGWVDPDTPDDLKTTVSFYDGKEYEIIMSDEFNRDGRSFADGDDPMWTAIEKSDDAITSSDDISLEYYNSSMVTTRNGSLIITTNTLDTKWRGWDPYKKKYIEMKRNFRSGMLQSWNKFCFTGGIFEVDIMFPGQSDIGGLWPAVWLLGNLGRATYEASTNLIWPWSYPVCDRKLQHAQTISGCDITTHYDLNARQGRGATEIDVIEVMAGPSGPLPVVPEMQRPYVSMTLQLAPGIPSSENRPFSMTLPQWGFKWYENLTFGENTTINPFFYGSYLGSTSPSEPIYRSKDEAYQCDAVSSISMINNSFWETMHKWRLEWQPGEGGYVRYYIDGVFRFEVPQSSLDFMNTKIPSEPSSIIINTAISTSWGFPALPAGCSTFDCKTSGGQCGFQSGFCDMFPAEMKIDSIRVYQNKKDPRMSLGCDPKEYPTARWIEGNAFSYKRTQDKQPLKPIVFGGANCDSDMDCGNFSGTCGFWKTCVCNPGWQGPRCLVPTYQNNFTNWDQNFMFIGPVTGMMVPTILRVAAVLFTLALGGATAAVIMRKRSFDMEAEDQYVKTWM